MRKLLPFLGILILVMSLAVLAWSYWPSERETRVQPISPSELTLPTPQSHLIHFYLAA